MGESEKIDFGEQELIDIMSQVTFNLGTIMFDMRSALGRYNDLPKIKEENEENIKAQLDKCERALERLRDIINLLKNKTNYNGVEEILMIENQILRLLTPLVDKVKKEPFRYAKEWRTGSGLDTSDEFEKVDLVINSFQHTKLFTRYTVLVVKTNQARKNIERSIQ